MNSLISRTIVAACLLLFVLSNTGKAQSKSDFVRGETIIFSDSLKSEQLGEFPSKWDLVTGTVEVYDFQGKKVIAYMSKANIQPLMTNENYLPETFTIEFDCYFHMQGNEAYMIHFGKAGTITVRSYFAVFKEHKGQTKIISKEPGWMHVAVSFNKRALKVYMNDDRVLNIPNVEEKPLNANFESLSFGAGKDIPSVIANILITEGGVKLYDRLMTDGKIVTNDIHFESGKAILKPESMKIIEQIVALMKEHPELKFRIEGHTDSDGTEQDNQTLSEKRAEAVKTAMVEKGIDTAKLTTAGYGESKSVADNSTEEAKAKNRRVEFVKIN